MQKTTINTRNFGIRLANEEIWQFISTSETSEWLDKLCIIMGLDEYIGVDSHKIIFLKNISNEYDTIKSLNLNGIHMLNTGPLRIYKCQSPSHIICEICYRDFPEVELFKMAQSIFPVYMNVLYQGGLPLHAALIERDGIGIAISAPGGTGKSTCTHRIPHPWRAFCDDELLIVLDKKGVYHAHPFPTWSRCNTQKPGETWKVQPMYLFLLFFSSRNPKKMK